MQVPEVIIKFLFKLRGDEKKRFVSQIQLVGLPYEQFKNA